MKKILFLMLLVSSPVFAEDLPIDRASIQASIDNFRTHADKEAIKGANEHEAMVMMEKGFKDYLFLLDDDKKEPANNG